MVADVLRLAAVGRSTSSFDVRRRRSRTGGRRCGRSDGRPAWRPGAASACRGASAAPPLTHRSCRVAHRCEASGRSARRRTRRRFWSPAGDRSPGPQLADDRRQRGRALVRQHRHPRRGEEAAADILLDEVRRAGEKFPTGLRRVNFFVTRWQASQLDPDPTSGAASSTSWSRRASNSTPPTTAPRRCGSSGPLRPASRGTLPP